MNHYTALLEVALAFYCIAGVMFLWNLVAGSERRSHAAFVPVVLGLTAHTAGLVMCGLMQRRMPFTNLFGALVFFAWALMAIYVAAERSYRITSLGTFTCFMASVPLVSALLIPRDVSSALIPVLQNKWSGVHIGSGLISYAGFVLAFGAALAYTLQERMLKTKRINSLQKHLPSLDLLDQFAYRMVAFSFPMLTLAIVTGALWAQTAWGSYWHWDPKETWALITWLVYAAYLHVRVMQGWRGKWANRLILTGFGCIIITFLGVNLLSNGLHRYNW